MASSDIRFWAVMFAAVPVLAIIVGGAVSLVG
jgi:hypothetical protein